MEQGKQSPTGQQPQPTLAGKTALITGGSRGIGRAAEFADLLTKAIRLLLYVMIPIAALVAVLRRPFIDILFGGGKIGDADLDVIATTLLWFLTGLAAHALIAVLARLRERSNVKVVTGVNLAMLVDFVFHLAQTPDAAASRAAAAGERAIKVP